LIYKCGGIDKRTIEKFEKVRIPPRRRLAHISFALSHILPLGGASLRFPQSTIFLRPGFFFAQQPALIAAQPSLLFLHRNNVFISAADSLNRKPLS
jgi:hypothetical protein